MHRYICGDLHLGHKNVHKYRTEFSSAEEHDELVWNNILELDSKRTLLFLMGDVCMTKKWLDKLSKLKSRTICIVGNHDTERGITMNDVVNAYDEVYSLMKYKGFWLSHAPIHPTELRGKKNIHGHTHPYLMRDPGSYTPSEDYISVCLEYTNFKPIEFEYAVSHEYRQHCLKEHTRRNLKGEIKT